MNMWTVVDRDTDDAIDWFDDKVEADSFCYQMNLDAREFLTYDKYRVLLAGTTQATVTEHNVYRNSRDWPAGEFPNRYRLC